MEAVTGAPAGAGGSAPKRKAVTLTLEQKVAVLRWWRAAPAGTGRPEAAAWVKTTYGLTVSVQQLSRLRKEGDELIDKAETAGVHQLGLKRARKGNVPELERLLSTWFKAKEAQGAVLPDAAILAKAKEFAGELGVAGQGAAGSGVGGGSGLRAGFNFSAKWLHDFKKRHGIGVVTLHGEAGSAPAENVAAGRAEVKELLKDVEPELVYNMDETGLFYRQLPRRSNVTKKRAGTKLAKDRFTAALTVNATGTDKLDVLIIGKSKKPRCFGAWKPSSSGVVYKNNASAWMDGTIFGEYLASFDRRMALKNRTAYLLMDNAGSHKRPTFTKEVTLAGMKGWQLPRSGSIVVFFRPNVTSHAQPLDQGIIAATKAHYRREHVRFHLAKLDEPEVDPKKIIVNAKQGCIWFAKAWAEVSEQTVRNCWVKADVLPDTVAAEFKNMDERTRGTSARGASTATAAAELSTLFGSLQVMERSANMDDPLAEMDEIDELERETEADVDTIEELRAAVGSAEESVAATGEEEEEEEEEAAEPIGLTRARHAAEALYNFVLENPGLAGFEDSLYKLKRAAYAMTECAATRQATLHSYFSTSTRPEPSTASQPSPMEL